MSLFLKEIRNKETWESFVRTQETTSFLQSWQFGQLHEYMGDEVFRYGLYNNEILKGAIQFMKVKAKRGVYLFCPYGPFLDWKNETMVAFFFQQLTDIAKRLQVDFIRIHPLIASKQEYIQMFKAYGYHSAPMHLVTDNFWIKDISSDESVLLSDMRKTTRNLIRKATKEGVNVCHGHSQELLQTFFLLYEDTVKRQKFTPYSRSFIEKQVDLFAKDQLVDIFVAYHQNTPLSAAIVIYYGKQASYHHGASLASKIPASYLLQWQAMLCAKQRGCTQYNFWGIVEGKPNHPWAGLSLFKKGFGGKQHILLNGQDKAMRMKYYVIYLFETLRKLKRGL